MGAPKTAIDKPGVLGYFIRMKTLLTLTLSLVFTGLSMAAEEIRKGDTVETVYEKLGKPNGVINLEDKQFLYYSRGHLEVIGDRVVKISMVSEEEYERER